MILIPAFSLLAKHVQNTAMTVSENEMVITQLC